MCKSRLFSTILAVSCSLLFAGRMALCADPGSNRPEQQRVMVDARNSQGELLRSSVGFVWDENTVVTSYSALRGASKMVIHNDAFQTSATEVMWSNANL